MQAGFQAVALMGFLNTPGFWGGLNLSGGDCANGMPKNLFTTAVAVGRLVVVPITHPASMLAVGD